MGLGANKEPKARAGGSDPGQGQERGGATGPPPARFPGALGSGDLHDQDGVPILMDDDLLHTSSHGAGLFFLQVLFPQDDLVLSAVAVNRQSRRKHGHTYKALDFLRVPLMLQGLNPAP